MPSFLFNDAKTKILQALLDLDGDTFYACLVTATPAATETQRIGLTEATGGNYAIQALTGRTLNNPTASTVRWTFSNPIWNNLTTANSAPIVGMVIVEQAGGSPATSDQPVCFLEFNTAFTPSGATFQVDIPVNTGVLTAT
jgi:hypothetical protein